MKLNAKLLGLLIIAGLTLGACKKTKETEKSLSDSTLGTTGYDSLSSQEDNIVEGVKYATAEEAEAQIKSLKRLLNSAGPEERENIQRQIDDAKMQLENLKSVAKKPEQTAPQNTDEQPEMGDQQAQETIEEAHEATQPKKTTTKDAGSVRIEPKKTTPTTGEKDTKPKKSLQ